MTKLPQFEASVELARDDDLWREFVAEFDQLAEQIQEQLSIANDAIVDPRVRAAIRADLHTLKGNAGCFGLSFLTGLLHTMESALELPNIEGDTACELNEMLVCAVHLSLDAVAAGGRASPELVQIERHLSAFAADVPARDAGAMTSPAVDGAAVGPSPSSSLAARSSGHEVVRVDEARLEGACEQIGELVQVQQQLMQICERLPYAARVGLVGDLAGGVVALGKVSEKLQRSARALRTTSLGTLKRKLERACAEAARTLNKRVELEVEGGDTEMDRSLIRHLEGPLMHLVRNAVDHGIEPDTRRRAAGKAERGRIRVRFVEHADSLEVEIVDDGGGVDVAAVERRARARGLLTPDEVVTDERRLIRMICAPGFSTREAITELSGRGVGMDVVCREVERAGGVLEIESRTGVGTSVSIRLPKASESAILPAIVVEAGGSSVAVLLKHVAAIRCLAQCEFDRVPQGEVLRFRGSLVPYAALDEVLGLRRCHEHDDAVVVLRFGELHGAVRVGPVVDVVDIIVQRVRLLKRAAPGLDGACVLPDGRIVPLLGPTAIAQRLGIEEGRGAAHRPAPSQGECAGRHGLVVRRDGDLFAIPLEMVRRVFEASPGELHRVGTSVEVLIDGSPVSVLGDVGSERDQTLVSLDVSSGTVAVVVDEVLDISNELRNTGEFRQGVELVLWGESLVRWATGGTALGAPVDDGLRNAERPHPDLETFAA